MFNILSRRTALAGLLVLGLSSSAFAADPPATGLGQSWPATTDVSVSPNWHAYVFKLGGIKYVQVNDLNGNVIGAVGTSNGQFITLPIGRFSQMVSTPQQAAAAPSAVTPAAAPTVVYRDDSTAIVATPMHNGAVKLQALTIGGDCTDPIVCATRAN